VPKLELRQPAYEWLELLISFCGERGGFFHVCVGFEGRVEFRADEGEEEVEQVDAE
jgi:hypothetical protein